MGDIIKFRRRPRNRGQFRIQRGTRRTPREPRRPRRKAGYGGRTRLALSLSVLVAVAALWWGVDQARADQTFACATTEILDGDTFDCDGRRIRLHGIDAPELPGHCRPGRDCAPGDPSASTENLRRLLASGDVQCRKIDTDVYGRTVAQCAAGSTDLSCAQLKSDLAIRRYGTIFCGL